MLRFCDREVATIDYAEGLNRASLLMYFLNGHRDNVVCVYKEGLYFGKISYASLLKNESTELAIDRNYAVVGNDIWERAAEYFENYDIGIREIPILPICSAQGDLLCFAYEDDEAKRQVRQVRELSELENTAVHFTDIYPEITNIIIKGCNELSFKFREYLKNTGVSVQVEGEIWQKFGIVSDEAGLDYATMVINAEGTWQKSKDLRKELQRTVGVCFECIDKIYEENIRLGNIQNTNCTERELINYLRNRHVIALGRKIKSIQGINYLYKNRIKIDAILDNVAGQEERYIFGIPVFTYLSIIQRFDNPIFIDCESEGSAWGGGSVDWYDYHGYRRNINYFVLSDYIEMKAEYPKNLIEDQKRIVLIGDVLLCSYLKSCIHDILKDKVLITYWDILNENNQVYLDEIEKDQYDLDETDTCLFIPAELNYVNDHVRKLYRRYEDALRKCKMYNYTELFEDRHAWNGLDLIVKFKTTGLKVKGIILGEINHFTGNILMRGILDGHPSIIKMAGYNYLNERMYEICVRLSQVKSEYIIEGLNDIFYKASVSSCDKHIFDDFRDWKMFCNYVREYLPVSGYVSAQELFVFFHAAYERIWGARNK